MLEQLSTETVCGVWEMTVENNPMINPMINCLRLRLYTEDGRLRGRSVFRGQEALLIDGSVSDRGLELSASYREKVVATFHGQLDESGDLGGELEMFGQHRSKWSARRTPVGPAQPAVREFQPTEYTSLVSSTAPPVLRLFPGESVRMYLPDSRGFDHDGVQRSTATPPLVGPFYIEGVLPGDTVTVRIDMLRLSGDTARSSDALNLNAIPPAWVHRLRNDNPKVAVWQVDRAAGTATLPVVVDGKEAALTVPVRPSLGCAAVAPAGNESLHISRLGHHGGDLDCQHFREGATLMLPASVKGGLLFLGDGHAAQGDGEISGDALEASTEVQFTVGVIEEHEIMLPRIEDASHLRVLGVGGDAGHALQGATGELGTWLQRDFGLGPRAVALLFAAGIEYSVVKCFTVDVCAMAAIPKSLLPAR
jgi:amidase